MSSTAEAEHAAADDKKHSETEEVQSIVGSFGSELKVEHIRTGSWFTRFVTYSLKKRAKRGLMQSTGNEVARAQNAIRKACLKSAVTGAASGAITTAGTLFTAEAPGAMALVALPITAAAIIGEMLYRTSVHIELTCDLADIFGVRFNPDEPSDLFRLYALAFKTETQEEESEEGSKELVERVAHLEGHQVGEAIGGKLLGESVMRNIVPFVGIAASSVMNYRMTQRVGDTVRRYCRYHRAFEKALEEEENHCLEHMDLLLEGFWFIFTADGQLANEEVASLASILRTVPPDVRKRAYEGFTRDETQWLGKLKTLPKARRPHFFRALQIAAAVDKTISTPERKILKETAKVLGVPYDDAEVDTMVRKLTETGLL